MRAEDAHYAEKIQYLASWLLRKPLQWRRAFLARAEKRHGVEAVAELKREMALQFAKRGL